MNGIMEMVLVMRLMDITITEINRRMKAKQLKGIVEMVQIMRLMAIMITEMIKISQRIRSSECGG